MKPNLTTGLFLNGRSSAAAPGRSDLVTISAASEQITVTDLMLNDTAFLESGTSMKEKHKDSRLSISEETDHEEDRTSDNLDPSPRPCTNFSTTPGNNKDTNTNEAVENGFREGSNSPGGTSPESCYESPGTMLKKLIKTGVFDGTGILDQKTQPNRVHDGGNNIFKKSELVEIHASRGGGLKASCTRKSQTLPVTTQPPSNNARSNQTCSENHLNKANDSLCFGHRDESLPLYIDSTTQVYSPDLANPVNVKDGKGHVMSQNSGHDDKTEEDSTTNIRRQSVSITSEGGHHYIQCVHPDSPPRPASTNFERDHEDFEYLVGSQNTQNPELQNVEQNVHDAWQRYSVNIPTQQWSAYRHPFHVIHGLDMPAPPMPSPVQLPEVHYSIQDGQEYEDPQLQEQHSSHGNETLQDFLERIEGEVSLR
ncbi:uncharacterized protein B0J16DRAFT_10473 [Fusarium flagelliforme]|nr:uncharacterized protein B0J16DRAFT_10473 [Fusarium flagelliforme]KAH7196990.1 hypothetical protein B0J16DRAFT_10473 [Fusarium flagelliforme]